ncbi:neprilysin-11-like isoform X2 [Prorops nasuta]
MGMNTSINPCDDFYEHSCGQWKERHPIPDDAMAISMHRLIETNLDLQIIDILTNTSAEASSKALITARDLYKSCLDVETLEKDGARDLLAHLQKNGNFLLLDPEASISSSNFWQKYLKMDYFLLKDNPLFILNINQNLQDSRTQMITIQKPALFLSETMKMNDPSKTEVLTAYKKYIYDVATYLRRKSGKCNLQLEDMEKDINELIELEIKLAMIKGNSSFNNKISIEEFQNLYNLNGGNYSSAHINWLEAIQFLFKEINFQITKSERLQFFNLDFFRILPEVLKDTNSRTISNYIVWNFIRSKINFSSKSLIAMKKEFIEQVNIGGLPEAKRELMCLRHPNLEKAISLEYVTRYLSESKKHEAQKFTNHILKVYKMALSKINWLDSTSKERSLEKLQAMRTFVGYPDNYTSVVIDNYYKKLNLGSNYLQSIISLEKFEYLTELKKLRKRNNRNEWHSEPRTMKASYKPSENSITITSAYLQPPILDSERPEVLNFALFGFVIAHEISHGFDFSGSRWDKDGNMIDLWTLNVRNFYKEILRCFIEQYSQYIIPGLLCENQPFRVDGLKTFIENIADSTGLQIAYDAFKESQRKNGGKEVRLVGMENVSSDKLFFIQYARYWCNNMREIQKLLEYCIDNHALREIRLKGSISNHRSFAKVFECKPNAPMNPSKKCSIL